MDTRGGWAWSNQTSRRGQSRDDSMTINRGRQVRPLCHARTVRRRKELTFTEITATDADGNVVAHAVQTYRLGG